MAKGKKTEASAPAPAPAGMTTGTKVALFLAVAGVAIKWKVDNTHSGQVGMMKAMFGWEKQGKFGTSSAEDVVAHFDANFADTVSIVTGANTGLGLEAARVIGKNGGTVVMACRTPARCELGKSKIEAEVKAGGGTLQCMEMDLGSLASVDKFVTAFLATGLKLKYLVNNAGIMALPTYQTTEEGVEKQWGVNHLGHFRLTTGLMDKLKDFGEGARVINLSSLAHLWWTEQTAPKPLTKDTYNDEAAYGTSKAANVLFTLGLRKRLEGSGVLTTSGHPGCIMTELGRNNQEMMDGFMKMFATLDSYFGINPLKTIPQGTATTLAMMLDDLPKTGSDQLYFADGEPGTVNGNYFADAVTNPENAEELWNLSEKLVAEYESTK